MDNSRAELERILGRLDDPALGLWVCTVLDDAFAILSEFRPRSGVAEVEAKEYIDRLLPNCDKLFSMLIFERSSPNGDDYDSVTTYAEALDELSPPYRNAGRAIYSLVTLLNVALDEPRDERGGSISELVEAFAERSFSTKSREQCQEEALLLARRILAMQEQGLSFSEKTVQELRPTSAWLAIKNRPRA